MVKELIFVIQESLEGGFEARALGESIFTTADSYDDIKKNISEAVHCHFDKDIMPTIIRTHFVKDEILKV